MMRTELGKLALCAALCAALSACGDDEGDDGTAPTGKKDAGSDAGRDAGRPPVPDAGPRKDAGHDTGPADEDAGHEHCDDASCAASADQCHVGSCNEATGQCEYEAKPDDTLCGSGEDTFCTDQDRCQAGVCVPNDAPAGTACGDTGVECRLNDACDGNGQCVDNGFEPANTACGSATDTACDDPDSCDATGTCKPNFVDADVPCGDVGVDCHHVDTCNGAGVCNDGALWEPDGVGGFSTCGAAGGSTVDGVPRCFCGDASGTNECSNVDICIAGTCSPNNINEGNNCGTLGVCELQRKCTSGVCTATPKNNGTVCGSADNDCQINKQCSAGSCLPVNKSNGAACGSATNAPPCNLADSCLNGACQPNHANSGTSCGDATANRECDGADSCQGGACNPNYYGPIVCGSAVGECELPDRCATGSCQADPAMFVAAGTNCGDGTTSDCDDQDSCDGAGSCDPNPKSAGVSCGDTSTDTECDAPDSCDGTGACDSNFAGSGDPCGDTSTDTECDGLDSCDGTGSCDDHLASSGVACGAPAAGCTLQDECDGSGQCEDLGVSGSCMGTITGSVVSDSDGSPLQGVSVSVYGAGLPAATTNAAGNYSLLAPLNQPLLFVFSAAAGHWGMITMENFTEADTDASQRRMYTDGFASALVGSFQGNPVQSTANAIGYVGFASGATGDGASLTATHGGSYTLDAAAWVPSSSLISSTVMLFANVVPGSGTTTVSVTGNGTNTCMVRHNLTTWPVIAHAVMAIEALCQ